MWRRFEHPRDIRPGDQCHLTSRFVHHVAEAMAALPTARIGWATPTSPQCLRVSSKIRIRTGQANPPRQDDEC